MKLTQFWTSRDKTPVPKTVDPDLFKEIEIDPLKITGLQSERIAGWHLTRVRTLDRDEYLVVGERTCIKQLIIKTRTKRRHA